MYRKTIAVLVAFLAAMGLGIGSAAADGSGSCTLTGGTVQLKVREYPGEGDVLYLRINSPVELTYGTPSPTHAYLFNSDGLQVNNTYYFYPAPIDGDGYWNYKATVNWDAFDEFTRIERVWFNVMNRTGSSQCGSSVYI
jgi:hypothetical protein